MDKKNIGYLKYSGKAVESGLLDIRKSAEVLDGFDNILKYFLEKENPQLKGKEFEIPVKIQQGSWETVIPEIAGTLFSPEGVGYSALGVYAAKTAAKAAEDGFLNTGLVSDINKILKTVLVSTQWTLKMAIHIGTMTRVKFEKVKWRNNNTEVGIPNDQGEYLFVPKKYLDSYQHCPKDLFSKVAKIVSSERKLEIGVYDGEKLHSVCITEQEKEIFYSEKEDEILFPELVQGQNVELEGIITRVNEKTNTIGFEYLGHVLTCKPTNRNIVTFKENIVSQEEDKIYYKVLLSGVVDRLDYDGETELKRPKIIFSKITPVKESNEEDQLSLI